MSDNDDAEIISSDEENSQDENAEENSQDENAEENSQDENAEENPLDANADAEENSHDANADAEEQNQVPVQNQAPVQNRNGRRRGRRPRAAMRVRQPPTMPTLNLKCFQLSTFRSDYSDATTTIEAHPASLILPNECFTLLTQVDIPCPWHFEITNPVNSKVVCCGVSMFIANEEGTCFMPDWIMENMDLKNGDGISLSHKKLTRGNYAKLEPQSVDFLEIKDPKAVLEANLSKFTCISAGDIFPISHNGKVCQIKVLETKPDSTISITNRDITVDFAPPVGYVDPSEYNDEDSSSSLGQGYRCDGGLVEAHKEPLNRNNRRGFPDWSFKIGEITFNRRKQLTKSPPKATSFQPFTGNGFTIRNNANIPDNAAGPGGQQDNSRENRNRRHPDTHDSPPSKIPKLGSATDVSNAMDYEEIDEFYYEESNNGDEDSEMAFDDQEPQANANLLDDIIMDLDGILMDSEDEEEIENGENEANNISETAPKIINAEVPVEEDSEEDDDNHTDDDDDENDEDYIPDDEDDYSSDDDL